MNGVTEQAGKVASATIDAFRGSPLALALLIINVMFLGTAIYILGEVAANTRAMDKYQNDLIAKLIADCRAPVPPTL
jgi:hypothetical protein